MVTMTTSRIRMSESSAQIVEIRDDVACVLLGDVSVRHGGARLEEIGLADPACELVRGIHQYAGDVHAAAEAVERRSDGADRVANARDAVAGTTAVVLQQRTAALGVTRGLWMQGREIGRASCRER